MAESERWPNQLAGMLLTEKDMQTELDIIARTGWTTSELWEGIQSNPPQGTYDLVSLLIGVNNQYRGYGIEEYRKEFRFLLNKSIEYAGGDAGHVIVLSIPDWGVTHFALGRNSTQIAEEIDMFNKVNREETESAGAHYVDIAPISRDGFSLIAGDGLHPSGKMYKMWAEEALPVAVESLIKK